MNASEQTALRQIQDENFRLRVELDHERRRISAALRALRGATDASMRPGSSDSDKAASLARIVDEATRVLNESL